MQTSFKLSKRYSFKSIWRITFPILVALVMEELLGMTDTAFLGRVGEIELGASAIAGVYFNILYMLGFGFSIGVQIIIGRRNGEAYETGKGFESIGRVFWQGVWFPGRPLAGNGGPVLLPVPSPAPLHPEIGEHL